MKRARNDPSSMLQPLVKRASDTLQMRRARKSRKDSTDGQAAAVIPPQVKARRSAIPAVIAVLALGLAAIGYLYLQHRAEDSRVDVAPAMTSPPVVATPLPVPTLTPLPALASTPAIQPVPETPARAKRTRVKAPVPLVIAPLPQVIAPPVQEVPLPKANIPAVQQPPDRRLQLRQRFAGCAGTDVLAQAYCEQRARLELCDGLWGTVPQCPPQRDYGS
ncbi:MAG: hypothetical protein ABI190_05385 [Casimicrobiaceae bacterium]